MLTRTLVAGTHAAGPNHYRAFQQDPRCHENLRSGLFLPEREAPSRRTSGAFLPIRTDLHRSCFRCWKLALAFASAPPNSGRQLVRDARQSQACRILMSIPGIGAITATAFTTAIERPDNFKKSRSVGAWIGLDDAPLPIRRSRL